MSKIATAFKLVRKDFNFFVSIILEKINFIFPDRLYLKMLFRLRVGYRLNLDNPKTFNEKLQWLKLYNRKPEYTAMVDKYLVKDYVAKTVGEQYVIPTLGVWDKFDDIDFSQLPDKFVLKTTHGGGGTGVVICKNKSRFDVKGAKRKLDASLKTSGYAQMREWPYKDVKRRIIAEQYIGSDRPELPDVPDYKWYCFNGKPMYCQVIKNRSTNESVDFFDVDWNYQEFSGLHSHYSHYDGIIDKPVSLNEMVDIAAQLSAGIPFARIDLYEQESKPFFGEITFYPASGFGYFKPKQYNEILGKMIDLEGV